MSTDACLKYGVLLDYRRWKKTKREFFQIVTVSVRLYGILVTKVLASGLEVSRLELQSHYYVLFRTSTHGKGMKPLILPVMG